MESLCKDNEELNDKNFELELENELLKQQVSPSTVSVFLLSMKLTSMYIIQNVYDEVKNDFRNSGILKVICNDFLKIY